MASQSAPLKRSQCLLESSRVKKRPACKSVTDLVRAQLPLPEFVFDRLLGFVRSGDWCAGKWHCASTTLSQTCRASWECWSSIQAASVAGLCHVDAALTMSAGKRKLSNLFSLLSNARQNFPLRLLSEEINRMAWAIACVPRKVRHVRSFVGQAHFSSRKCTGWKRVLTSGKDTSIASDICKVGNLSIQIVLVSFAETCGDGLLRITLAVNTKDNARGNRRRVCVAMFGVWARVTPALFAESTLTGSGYRALLHAIPREIMDAATFRESKITVPIGIVICGID